MSNNYHYFPALKSSILQIISRKRTDAYKRSIKEIIIDMRSVLTKKTKTCKHIYKP